MHSATYDVSRSRYGSSYNGNEYVIDERMSAISIYLLRYQSVAFNTMPPRTAKVDEKVISQRMWMFIKYKVAKTDFSKSS